MMCSYLLTTGDNEFNLEQMYASSFENEKVLRGPRQKGAGNSDLVCGHSKQTSHTGPPSGLCSPRPREAPGLAVESSTLAAAQAGGVQGGGVALSTGGAGPGRCQPALSPA